MKPGDRLICKKDFLFNGKVRGKSPQHNTLPRWFLWLFKIKYDFKKGNYYEISRTISPWTHTGSNCTYYEVKGVHGYFSYSKEFIDEYFFYSSKEIRKLKLNKINECT